MTLIPDISNWISPYTLFPAAYLLGSINFAILLFKVLGKADPREGCSGNPGTTNVYRLAGLPWAIVVFLLDVGRAVLIAWIALHYLPVGLVTWAGLFLILGNRFPCFHRFKGGKGVANYLGFSAVISLWAAVVSGICWLIVNRILKIPFIASFAMVTILAIGTILELSGSPGSATGTILTVLLIVYSHKSNIQSHFLNRKSGGAS